MHPQHIQVPTGNLIDFFLEKYELQMPSWDDIPRELMSLELPPDPHELVSKTPKMT